MRIRASVLTPILAIMTVAALISTGIVLGQEDRGDADATLLGSTPDFPAPVGTETSLVAEADPAEAEEDLPGLAQQTFPTAEPAPTEPQVLAEERDSSSQSASATRPSSADPATALEGDDSSPDDEEYEESEERAVAPVREESDESEYDGSESHESDDD
jgi:hypothetical protein